MKKKNLHPKMDPRLISKQKHELDWAVHKMKLEGISVTRHQVLAAIKAVGNSRGTVYNKLRGK